MMYPMKTSLQKYAAFIALFIGTGFMAGSIVHFGEGVTTWDVSVLVLGIILFVIGSYIQEKERGGENLVGGKFLPFILLSSVLSLGVGMASGGVQHFIDTPGYSAVLIPLGLAIGYVSYSVRERFSFTSIEWTIAIISAIAFALIGWKFLVFANTLIPDSLRVGHGSHGHHVTVSEVENHAEHDSHDDHH